MQVISAYLSISLIFLGLSVVSEAFVISRQYSVIKSLDSRRDVQLCVRSSRTEIEHPIHWSMETIAQNKRWPSSLIERKLSAVYPTSQSDAPPKTLQIPGPFERAIKKPTGTMSIIGSIKRSDPSFEKPINGFKNTNEISAALHDAKVAAIACWTDQELSVPNPSYQSTDLFVYARVKRR